MGRKRPCAETRCHLPAGDHVPFCVLSLRLAVYSVCLLQYWVRYFCLLELFSRTCKPILIFPPKTNRGPAVLISCPCLVRLCLHTKRLEMAASASLASVRLGTAGPLAATSVTAWLPASLSCPWSSPAHWPPLSCHFYWLLLDANSGAIEGVFSCPAALPLSDCVHLVTLRNITVQRTVDQVARPR